MTIDQVISQAISLHQAGQLEQAEAMYRQVLSEDRQHAVALHFLGLIAFQRGRAAVAAELIEKSLAISPADALPWRNLATVYKSLGRLPDALAAAEKALAIAPHFMEARIARAELLADLGRLEESVTLYDALKEQYPMQAPVLVGRAKALEVSGKTARALEAYEELSRLASKEAAWPAHAAAIHAAAGRLKDAAALYTIAVQRESQPQHLSALAEIQMRRGQLGEVESAAQSLLKLKPDDPAALALLARALERRGDHAQTAAAYQRAVDAAPDNMELRETFSEFLLRDGDYERGFAQRIFRYRNAPRGLSPRAAPLWDGNVLFAKRIFLHAGNMPPTPAEIIAATRFIPMIKELGGHVILEMPAGFERLLSRMRGVDQFIKPDQTPEAVDVQCPLAILPGVMRVTPDTIPDAQFSLSVDSELAATWLRRLKKEEGEIDPEAAPPVRIGVVWHADPHCGVFETYAREILASLIKTAGTHFYSLQRGSAGGIVAPPAGLDLIDLTADLRDFADQAAMISHLHLVIGLDAPPIHVAGALGVPTWLMLPRRAHWLWMENRPDSPWYPSIRLFRQDAPKV